MMLDNAPVKVNPNTPSPPLPHPRICGALVGTVGSLLAAVQVPSRWGIHAFLSLLSVGMWVFGWDLMKYFFKIYFFKNIFYMKYFFKIIMSKLILYCTQLIVNASLALNSNSIQQNPLLFWGTIILSYIILTRCFYTWQKSQSRHLFFKFL